MEAEEEGEEEEAFAEEEGLLEDEEEGEEEGVTDEDFNVRWLVGVDYYAVHCKFL